MIGWKDLSHVQQPIKILKFKTLHIPPGWGVRCFFTCRRFFFHNQSKSLNTYFIKILLLYPLGGTSVVFFLHRLLLFQNGCQGSVRSCSVSTPGVLCRSCHQISTNQYRAPNNIMFCICCVRTKNLSNNFVRTCAEYNNVISAQTVCVRTWSSLWANTWTWHPQISGSMTKLCRRKQGYTFWHSTDVLGAKNLCLCQRTRDKFVLSVEVRATIQRANH